VHNIICQSAMLSQMQETKSARDEKGIWRSQYFCEWAVSLQLTVKGGTIRSCHVHIQTAVKHRLQVARRHSTWEGTGRWRESSLFLLCTEDQCMVWLGLDDSWCTSLLSFGLLVSSFVTFDEPSGKERGGTFFITIWFKYRMWQNSCPNFWFLNR
jgi:hypothetical protein